MKKHLLPPLLLLLCFGYPVYSQHSLQSNLNMFRAEDEIVKQHVSYKDPGRSGANVLWDFSKLDVVNDAYRLSYLSYNDTLITGIELQTMYDYTLQNDSLLLWGFNNQTTRLRNHQPELLLKFPVVYGNKTKSYYYSHGKYANRLEMDAMGTIETEADAYGMMILPNKDTLKHILRVHSLKYIAQTTQPIGSSYFDKLEHPLSISADSVDYRLANDSVLFVVETYRWYEKGYRYPVFETVRSWEQHLHSGDYEYIHNSLFYPPQEHYYLDNDESNLALLEESDENEGGNDYSDPWKGLSYNIYPNPVSTFLELEMYLPKSANIRIELRSTIGLVLLNENKGFHPEGICNFQFDMITAPIGSYILDVWLDEKLISEIILKR